MPYAAEFLARVAPVSARRGEAHRDSQAGCEDLALEGLVEQARGP